MKFRRVPSLDWEVSVLGVGAALAPDALMPASVDSVADGFVAGFRQAVDRGVNYLDLGWFDGMEHPGPWAEIVGAALADGYREQVRIAANVPPRVAASREEWLPFLEELTTSLQTDRLDFCVVGGVDRTIWDRLSAAGLPDYAGSIVDEGAVDALGFFICDDLQVVKRAVGEYGDWKLCKTRYGFWDHLKSRPGSTGVQFAFEQGLMVVAAEPTRGAFGWRDAGGVAASAAAGAAVDGDVDGAHDPEADLRAIAGLEGQLDEWDLRWAWDDPGVSTVVCDLACAADPDCAGDLARYLELADRAEPRSLSISELTALGRVKDHYVKNRPVLCPACRSCMPCPEGVDIPRILDLYNDASLYGGVENARAGYRMEQLNACDCTNCGACVEACPLHIAVPEELSRIRSVLESTVIT